MLNKKKTSLMAVLLLVAVTLAAQDARFATFSYSGNDNRFCRSIDPEHEYFNPILAGFFPDPSICRVGDTYYLVCSSFTFVPGVPLFTSSNLVDWQPMGGVLTRPKQLPLDGQQVSAGIFAPSISYNERNKTFYMITTNVGMGNFFVKTQNPAEGWSDPIRLPEVDGIDPSFFFDKDGRAYIVHNGPVIGGHDYEGQRSIRLLLFDVEGDSIVPLPAKGLPEGMAHNDYALEILRGGTHVEEHPIWIEGPHLFRRGRYYYLMCAEGGTGPWHSEVILRSRSLFGPWEEAPNNPILTQRKGLDPQRPDIVTSAGHADLIETADGQWWAVFLGCRPYEADYYSTGRDTYLLPVTWSKDGWPTILPSGKVVPTIGKRPKMGTIPSQPQISLTGNFSYSDDFGGDTLTWRWMTLRNHDRNFYATTDSGLVLLPSTNTLHDRHPLAAIFCRQQHTHFTAETTLAYAPEKEGDLAGLAILQNEDNHFVLGKTICNGQSALVLTRSAGRDSLLALVSLSGVAATSPMRLRIEGDGRWYTFSYALAGDGNQWHVLAERTDGINLSTCASGGFIGAVIGLYNTKGFVLPTTARYIFPSDYMADPAAHIFDGRIYIYPSHDLESGVAENDNGDHFDMRDYHVLVMDSIGQTEARDLGKILDIDDIPWAKRQLWDNDVCERDGRYYMYFCAKDYTDTFRLGVASSDSPAGPFLPQPEPIRDSYSIDPCVFKDNDGQYYLYFGGIWGGQLQHYRDNQLLSAEHLPEDSEPALPSRVARLSDDMLQFAEAPRSVVILDAKGHPLRADDPHRFFEASWMFRHGNTYYFTYSTGDSHLLCYATGDNPYGPSICRYTIGACSGVDNPPFAT